MIERSTTIAIPIGEVFDFVSDPCSDPIWCPKVKTVDQLSGDGPGARYVVVHRPIPPLPARRMDYTLLAWDPPNRIEWHEDDGHDVFDVTYLLESTCEGTRFSQRSDAQLAAPRVLHALMRIGIGHDVAAQLKRLRAHLQRT